MLFPDRISVLIVVERYRDWPVAHVARHPAWSYQIAFDAARFAEIVPWLVLNHGVLDLFLHPNTGDALRDHRDAAMWIGKSYALNLDALG